MDSALILADQIIGIIRSSGATKVEAYSALKAVSAVLPSITDVGFDHEAQEQAEPLPPS